RRRWKPRAPLRDRATDLAWTQMVPLLHAGGYQVSDGEFVAGLALLSPDHGRVDWRRPILESVEQVTTTALMSQATAAGHRAALRRLAIHAWASTGGDPIPPIVAELAQSLEGRLPLACAEALLADWQAPWWTAGNRKRLRALLCDQAFGAGFEVSHLLEI